MDGYDLYPYSYEIRNKFISLSLRDVIFLKKTYEDKYPLIQGNKFCLSGVVLYNKGVNNKMRNIDNYPSERLNIHKIEDEYFILVVARQGFINSCYKCDQIEGLLNCINDNYG